MPLGSGALESEPARSGPPRLPVAAPPTPAAFALTGPPASGPGGARAHDRDAPARPATGEGSRPSRRRWLLVERPQVRGLDLEVIGDLLRGADPWPGTLLDPSDRHPR